MTPRFNAARPTDWLFNTILVLMLGFLLLPILLVVPLSFSSGDFFVYPLPGVSMRWYAEFFNNPVWMGSFRNSLVVALCTMVFATTLGTLAAVGLWRSKSWIGTTATALLISPLIIPVVIVAIALFFLYARLGFAGSMWALVMGHTAISLPLVVLTVGATLQGFNPNMTRAALSLGATPVQAFFGVMLPLIAPGVATGALFAFATSFDEAVLSLFLGSPEQRTLPRQIFSGLRESITPVVAVAATLIIVLATSLLLLAQYLRSRAERLREGRDAGL
ncbi:ABC transporter permease [Mesorhizobium sp. CO1-1-8]|uniref:ABC transporter permease n=1 Tax=Mesorhizobium sp. CO1-1-8 TaxID=2876631 RepID=UPI001CD19310|nr:ABC transporter permease [Mesorhizobium sp. CO1-1-8]MBZ9772202.1 ABC transporter permease [Mesorhizobium sp. CO1-1-8]